MIGISHLRARVSGCTKPHIVTLFGQEVSQCIVLTGTTTVLFFSFSSPSLLLILFSVSVLLLVLCMHLMIPSNQSSLGSWGETVEWWLWWVVYHDERYWVVGFTRKHWYLIIIHYSLQKSDSNDFKHTMPTCMVFKSLH